MDKKEVRIEMKERRKALSPEYRATASEAISRSVGLLAAEHGAKSVMLYRSLPGEVDLDSLADELAAEGIAVLLPKVDGELLEIRLYAGPDSLQKGSFNIMEPVGPLYEGPIDMVVVPGLSFDFAGGRLGFGRGFYDRFLASLPPDTLKAGVCFDKMLLDEVPVEPHDVPMDVVVTESVNGVV